MESLRRTANKVDDVVFQVERLLLLVCLAAMTVLVSLDVVQRTFSRPVGKTEGALLAVFYTAPTDEQTAFVTGTLGPVLFGLFAWVMCILAVQSARSIAAERAKQPSPKFGRSIAVGTGVVLGLTAFVKVVLWIFPSSVPGAQKFALGFMLWAGLLGASLATRTRRHIILDPIKKKLDEATLKPFSLIGGVVTFCFCGTLSVLGWMQLHEQFTEWRGGDGVGVYDALPVPLWVGTLSIPVTFGVMALRFLAQGINDFKWGPPKGGADAHGVDLEALEKEQLPMSEAK